MRNFKTCMTVEGKINGLWCATPCTWLDETPLSKGYWWGCSQKSIVLFVFAVRSHLHLYRHLVSDGGDYEVYLPLGYDVACSARNVPTYRRNVLSSSGGRVKRSFGNSSGCISSADLQHLWIVWSIQRGSIFGTILLILLLYWSNISLASG